MKAAEGTSTTSGGGDWRQPMSMFVYIELYTIAGHLRYYSYLISQTHTRIYFSMGHINFVSWTPIRTFYWTFFLQEFISSSSTTKLLIDVLCLWFQLLISFHGHDRIPSHLARCTLKYPCKCVTNLTKKCVNKICPHRLVCLQDVFIENRIEMKHVGWFMNVRIAFRTRLIARSFPKELLT